MQTIYGVTSGENIVQAFTEENTTEANFHQSINNAAILTFTTTEPLKAGVQFFLTKDPINDYKHEEFMYFEITDQDFDGYEYTYRAEEYAYHDLDTMGYVKKVYTQGKWTTRTLLESIVYNDVEPKGVARTKWEVIDNDLTLPTTWAGEGNTYTLWYNTPLRGIEKFIEYFGGEIRFYVTIFNNKISRHYLEIYEKRGRETGKRYESNSNLISLTNKAEYDNRYEYIIPLGEGGGTSGDEQKHNTPNGFNNYITLEGLEVGKSTDKWYKPKSQMYISLANDKNAYPLKSQPKGLQNNPRIKPVTFEDVKSKQALFNKAIEWLENNQGVAWSYSASVLDIGESQVGDTIAIIDERSGISSYVRVHDIDYDMIDPENTGVHFGSNWGYENDEAITDMLNTATAARHDTIALIDTAIRQSNGKNTNYYGKNEPADPTAGDLWYKQAGDETYLMIFKDGQWVELVSTRTQKVISDAVDEATSEANSYADSLNATQASEAAVFQSEANAALSSAAAERTVFSSNATSMASSAATHADSMANSASAYAKAQAASALSSANSALTTAKSDLTTAIEQETEDRNKAVSAVNSQAQDYAEQAKSDAIAAAKTADGQVKKDFKETADSLSSTISQNKEDAEGKISTAQTTATQALDGLKTKVSQSDYDKKTGDLSTAVNTVTQTANETKNELANVSKTVDSQSSKINTISNTVDGTTQTISDIQTEQGKQSGSIATLQSRADGFDATVTKVNNLSVGGRNYVLNSDVSTTSNITNFRTSIPVSSFSGKIITMSVQVDYDNITELPASSTFNRIMFEPTAKDGKTGKTRYFSTIITPEIGDSFHGRISTTFDLTNVDIISQFTGDASVNIWGQGIYVQGVVGTNVSVSRPKIEIGNQATDWTPAPEDVDSALAKVKLTADNATLAINNYKTDADGRISKAQSDITATSKEVKTKVSQSDYDTKTGDLTTKYGQVKATADAVTTDVANYKKSNDGKVSANEAGIRTLSDQITSKVSQTDFDKKTGELNGKFTQQKQTVDSISQTVTELQAKANAQGQVNQLMNTEFSPDLQGWSVDSTDGKHDPYRSYLDKNVKATTVGFYTLNADTSKGSYFARFYQSVPLGTAGNGYISLSWQSYLADMADNMYGHIWIKFHDKNGNAVYNSTGANPMGNWISNGQVTWKRQKMEKIEIPQTATEVTISFEAREGIRAYLVRPMLVFDDHTGDYAQGNYNNNARVAALEVDLNGITGLVNDPKKGLSATANLAANGLSVATTAKNDATTAIQTAKGVQTKVEQMGSINLLINTEFNPDLEGWELTSDGGNTRLPYRSYLSKDINATTVGFNTMNSATSSWSNLSQKVQLSSTSTSGTTISLSWSSWAREVANYNGLHILFYDNKDTQVGDEYREWTTRGGGGSENSYAVRKKWENITVPDTATYLILKFQAREGTGAYLAQPMLVMGSTIGDYVAGNYNNNNSLESTRTQLAGQITDEIKDRKSGDESVVTQTTKLIDQRVKSVEKGYESAISQSADTIMASVSTPNLLLNTNFTPDLENWNATQKGGTTNHTWYRSILDDQGHTAAGINIPDSAGSDSNKHYGQLEQDIRMPGWKNNVKLSLSWRVQVRHMLNYAWLWVTFLNGDKSVMKRSDGSTANAGYNYGATGNNADGKWHDGKFENIAVPDGCVYIRVSFQAREGTNLYLTSPMATFTSKAQSYTAGSYSGMNTSTVLTLAKDNWALGIADNAGRIISGINGDKSGTVIQGKKLVINSDTTINGKAFIDGSVIKNASIGTAQIGKAAVGSAQIINVDVSKISGNIANFITANVDRLNARVLYGDTGHLGTTDTGRVINKQDNHLQLASKGMYNSANDRAQIELLSHTNDIDANMRGSFNYYSDVRKGHGLGIRLVQNQILAIDEDKGSKMLYLSPYQGGEVRVVSRDKKAYYPMRASSFNAMSSRSAKSNIEPFEDCALDIVKNTKVRTYVKSGKQEIGVISDEADPRMLTDDDNAVSLYDYTSILYKAVQELSEQVEELQKERPNDY